MSPANSDRVVLSYLDAFSLSCLGLPIQCWIKWCHVSCLIPDSREKAFSFSLLNTMLAVVCHIQILLRYTPSIITLFRVFIINGYWILLKVFLHLLRKLWCLVFNISMWIDLQILNHPCIPRINFSWSQYMILLMYCWIWFASILLRSFASTFIRDISLCYLPL